MAKRAPNRQVAQLRYELDQARRAASGVQKGRRRRGRGRSRGGRQPDRLTGAALSYVNPFSVEMYKVPDEFSGKSLVYRARAQYTQSPDGTHKTSAHLFLPSLEDCSLTGVVNGLGSISSWASATSVPDYVTLSATMNRYRLVSWGVRITSTAPATLASGALTVLTFGDTTYSLGHFSSNNTAMRRDIYAVTPGLDVTWVSEPIDNGAREYVAMDAISDWTYPVIWHTGGEVGSYLMFDLVFTFEAIAKPGTIGDRLSTQAAPDNPPLLKRIHDIYQHASSTFNTAGYDVRSTAWLRDVVLPAAVTYGAKRLASAAAAPSFLPYNAFDYAMAA